MTKEVFMYLFVVQNRMDLFYMEQRRHQIQQTILLPNNVFLCFNYFGFIMVH